MNGAGLLNKRKLSTKSVYKYSKTIVNATDKVFWIFFIILSATFLYLATYHNKNYFTAFSLISLILSLAATVSLLKVSEESLLLVAPIGLQTIYVSSLGFRSSHFIPWSDIQDIVINEAVQGFRIIRYLAVIVKPKSGATQLYPLLQNSRLRLKDLKSIYNNIQDILSF